jgi:hypothetical protein
MCANRDPDGLNPWKWDIFEVNSELGKLKIWAFIFGAFGSELNGISHARWVKCGWSWNTLWVAALYWRLWITLLKNARERNKNRFYYW